ncbi:hypothetical protein Ahy_B07g087921 isoform A [Arachis hypogaea]|uniref:Uncharacterized protein n=1 Tax=Arachis hypogaea TaxID=3818 RepID=A0A444YDB4_ARAHY|nr:hypothetical protein Ahy_B07g087921 isoform A [Arachis hypogaea]
MQCSESRIGPAGRTGSTGNRQRKRSDLTCKTVKLKTAQKPLNRPLPASRTGPEPGRFTENDLVSFLEREKVAQTAAAVHRTQELPSSCSRASRRILHVGCSHLAVLLCARLLAPPSASECSSCACWLLLVVRGCLCSILPPSLTRVSSQSLASRGSSVSSPAVEATRGVVADSPSIISPCRRRSLSDTGPVAAADSLRILLPSSVAELLAADLLLLTPSLRRKHRFFLVIQVED